jgi:hypothetical protein
MATTLGKVLRSTTEPSDSLPELRPWRDFGWIFKDGEAIAIEREADEAPLQPVVAS